MSALSHTLSDSVVITRRNLIKVKRVPDLIVFATLSPIMFVLLFRYVFGGAIGGLPDGISYAEFLLPGIFAQTVVFGSTTTARASPRTCRRGWSTGSGRCRCPGRPCSSAARSPTSASTPSPSWSWR